MGGTCKREDKRQELILTKQILRRLRLRATLPKADKYS